MVVPGRKAATNPFLINQSINSGCSVVRRYGLRHLLAFSRPANPTRRSGKPCVFEREEASALTILTNLRSAFFATACAKRNERNSHFFVRRHPPT